MVGMIVGSALKNTGQAKERIIAINIAREGLEAVRNIRDTNWLKFSGQRRQCWNHLPSLKITDPCTGQTPIVPGRYIVYKQDQTMQWRLFYLDDSRFPAYAKPPQSAPNGSYFLNTSDQKLYVRDQDQWLSVSHLDLVDIDPNVDTDRDGNSKNDTDIYNHRFPKGDQAAGLFSGNGALDRVIQIEYLDNTGQLISDAAAWKLAKNQELDRMRVTSKVEWKSRGNTFDVELSTHLTDYLK